MLLPACMCLRCAVKGVICPCKIYHYCSFFWKGEQRVICFGRELCRENAEFI